MKAPTPATPAGASRASPASSPTEQLAGWANVTAAVHAEGGRIFAQVMHAGRVTHEDTTGGHEVVAPSAIAIDGETRTYEGKQAFPVPHALTTDELPGIVAGIRHGSRNAIEAGFDGVELHSANGYLLHEFLAPSANQRDDIYGGSPENRARFVIEVIQAVVDAVGADRVGIRISPEHNVQGALELDAADVRATYGHLVDALAPLKLAYLSILHKDPTSELVQDLRARFNGTFLVNTGFGVITTRDEAIAWSRTATLTPSSSDAPPSPTRTWSAAGAKACRSTSRIRPRSTPTAPRATPTTRPTRTRQLRRGDSAAPHAPRRHARLDMLSRSHDQWAESHTDFQPCTNGILPTLGLKNGHAPSYRI